MHLVSLMRRALTVSEVHAHCDIPCGIYDPIAAKIAAQTVQKMVMRIEALDDAACDASSGNSFSRYVAVKEEHAQHVKDEVSLLWSDYFKPEHVEKYPGPSRKGLEHSQARRPVQADGRHGRLKAAGGIGRRGGGHLLGHEGSRVLGPGRRGSLRNLGEQAPHLHRLFGADAR